MMDKVESATHAKYDRLIAYFLSHGTTDQAEAAHKAIIAPASFGTAADCHGGTSQAPLGAGSAR